MKRSSLVRLSAAFAFSIAVIPVVAQDAPALPPSLDTKVWATPNHPYILSITATSTTDTHVGKAKIYRNSAGVVREESFYNNGKLFNISLREAGKENAPTTQTICNVVPKTCFVIKIAPPMVPRPPHGYTVEKLGPRMIAGIEARGWRFTRTAVNTPDNTSWTEATEEWVSNELGVVLERTVSTNRAGSVNSTRTVTELQKAEPDPALFTIPEGYTMLQPGQYAKPGQPGPIPPQPQSGQAQPTH